MPTNPHKIRLSLADEVASIILAGGQGTRLFPLTKHRCKPAVSFGGRYKLIDIPLSNSLNSGISTIFVISQYFSSGLNSHINSAFKLDDIHRGGIEFLFPDENTEGKIWYEGTADSVRKNLHIFKECDCQYFMILSGDQLYNMNLFEMLQFSKEKNADLCIATLPIEKNEATRMGLLKLDDSNKIVDFVEKPQEEDILSDFSIPNSSPTKYLASMGIYLFKKEVLISLLESTTEMDFGKDLIPNIIKEKSAYSYCYDGYWEDIGTISAFYQANLALTRNDLGLELYDETLPIYAKNIHLPSARIHKADLQHSIVSQGSIIEEATLNNCLLGPRCHVKKGSVLKNTIVLGNQFYTPPTSMQSKLPSSFSIGENCHIEKAIIDEHVSIGNNVKLINEKNLDHFDGDGFYIRDGIIVITSGTTLPDNFSL